MSSKTGVALSGALAFVATAALAMVLGDPSVLSYGIAALIFIILLCK